MTVVQVRDLRPGDLVSVDGGVGWAEVAELAPAGVDLLGGGDVMRVSFTDDRPPEDVGAAAWIEVQAWA